MRIAVNGTRLFFDVEGPSLGLQGRALHERPTLVALHGGPGVDHAVFRPYLAPLSRTAQVVYLDLRGNGRSDPGTPDHWNLATWADDVRAFCDALEIRRPVVLGLSFGGFVAQAYATRFPDHPGGLVLCSTNARFDLARSLAVFEHRGGPVVADVARRFFADPTPGRLQEYIDHCLPFYARLPIETPSADSIRRIDVARHFVGGEWHTFDFTADLAKIRCPTLVMAGLHDPVLPFEGSREMAARIDPALLRFEAFPECGHALLAEEPERARATIEAFIS